MCGNAVSETIAGFTGDRCYPCFDATRRTPTMRVKVQGAVVDIHRKSRRERKGDAPPARRPGPEILEGARRRALAELRDRHHDEYLDLLAHERAELGLDPYPVQWLEYKTMHRGEG